MPDEPAVDQLIALIERQNEFLRVLARPIAQDAARQRLRGRSERKVYELTDGTRSSRQIEAKTGVSKSTVSRWWRTWRNAGLIVEPPKANARALFPIDELELPAVDSSTNKASTGRKRKD